MKRKQRPRYTIEDLLYRCGRWERKKTTVSFKDIPVTFYCGYPFPCSSVSNITEYTSTADMRGVQL